MLAQYGNSRLTVHSLHYLNLWLQFGGCMLLLWLGRSKFQLLVVLSIFIWRLLLVCLQWSVYHCRKSSHLWSLMRDSRRSSTKISLVESCPSTQGWSFEQPRVVLSFSEDFGLLRILSSGCHLMRNLRPWFLAHQTRVQAHWCELIIPIWG